MNTSGLIKPGPMSDVLASVYSGQDVSVRFSNFLSTVLKILMFSLQCPQVAVSHVSPSKFLPYHPLGAPCIASVHLAKTSPSGPRTSPILFITLYARIPVSSVQHHD
jgi:hypothetical protein